MTNPTPWAPLYRVSIASAAQMHDLPPFLLLALAWQESHGGVVLDAGRWDWSPRRIYRYEPGFWDRYLAGKPEWAPPSEHPACLEAHKRRVSASYGIVQVMYPTAVELGFGGEPEALFEPSRSLHYGAKLLRKKLDGPAKGDMRDALAAYNTGRARDEWTTSDDEVLEKLDRIKVFAAAGGDPFAA
jgi:hypothetical protein